MIPSYLLSKDECEKKFDSCYGDCAEAVKRDPESGRWFITMGHPGFNNDRNNGAGYKHRSRALAAIKQRVQAFERLSEKIVKVS